MPRVEWADRLVRWTTAVSVVVLAGIAAVISYKHMFTLVHRYGETSWTAALLPLSVDGMIVASSMSLLEASRMGRRSGVLPWALLVLGSAASLAANVAVAEPSAVGRVIAAWPSAALIGSYELLMRQVRQASTRNVSEQDSRSHESPAAMTSNDAVSYEVSDGGHTDHAASYGSHIPDGKPSEGSYEVLTREFRLLESASGQRRSRSGLQRQAWHWAQANRTPAGDLPSGKEIAARFGRRERWGRLVKQTGHLKGWTLIDVPSGDRVQE